MVSAMCSQNAWRLKTIPAAFPDSQQFRFLTPDPGSAICLLPSVGAVGDRPCFHPRPRGQRPRLQKSLRCHVFCLLPSVGAVGDRPCFHPRPPTNNEYAQEKANLHTSQPIRSEQDCSVRIPIFRNSFRQIAEDDRNNLSAKSSLQVRQTA